MGNISNNLSENQQDHARSKENYCRRTLLNLKGKNDDFTGEATGNHGNTVTFDGF